jgi:hypothetical protein
MASSSVNPVCASARMLNAEFDIAEHPQLADHNTNQFFSEYVTGIFRGRDPYLAHNLKGTTLISFSLPTDLSSLSDRGVVPVLGIFHGSHEVSNALHGYRSGIVWQHQRSHSDMERLAVWPWRNIKIMSCTSCSYCFSSQKSNIAFLRLHALIANLRLHGAAAA